MTQENTRLKFNITTVMGDFLEIRKIHVKKNFAENHTVFDYKKHIFTKVFSKKTIDQYVYFEDDYYFDVEKAFAFFDEYRKLSAMKNINNYSVWRGFEGLKNRFDVNFAVEISLPNESEDEIALSYDSKMFEYSELKSQKSWFTYTCTSICDMVASILHFYMINGYKLASCNHCWKIFATKTLKVKYCQRKSSFKNPYSQKSARRETCEKTVRRELQYLNAIKTQIDDRLHNRIKNMTNITDSELVSFRDKSLEYIQIVKKSPTHNNLLEYNKYLYEINKDKRGNSK